MVDTVNGSFVIDCPLSVGISDTAASLLAQVPSAVDATWFLYFGAHVSSGEWLVNPLGAGTPKAFSNPSRSLNTAFQPSTTQDTLGTYSVSIASSLSLTGGQAGSIVLEYADDSGITTNVKTVAQVANGNTGALTLGLSTLQTYGAVTTGIIPAGKYARLRSVNVTGTPTMASVNAQEVQF